MRLTNPERELATNVDFDIDICRLIKDAVRKPLERALRVDSGIGETPGDGLSVRTRTDSIAGFVDRYQALLTTRGYSTFWSSRSEGRRPRDEMVVLKTDDDREIIRWRGTTARQRGLSTDDILAELDRWSVLCRFHVIGAAADWIAVAFTTLPGDVGAFAKDICAFCPGAPEQNVGALLDSTPGVGARLLARHLTETSSLFLWWE